MLDEWTIDQSNTQNQQHEAYNKNQGDQCEFVSATSWMTETTHLLRILCIYCVLMILSIPDNGIGHNTTTFLRCILVL
jgi:hypothetical protein